MKSRNTLVPRYSARTCRTYLYDGMASAEEEVLRQRLLAKETSLRQLTRHYLSFVESVESSTAEQVAAAHANLLKEITAYEFSVSKAGMLVDTNLRQICEYDEMQQKIDAEMSACPATPNPVAIVSSHDCLEDVCMNRALCSL